MRSRSIWMIVFLLVAAPVPLRAQEFKAIFQKGAPAVEQKQQLATTFSLLEHTQFQALKERDRYFLNIFCPRSVRRPSKYEERLTLRQEWKDMLGVDIFRPYFQVQEFKQKVEGKGKIRIFSMSGKPEIDEAKQQVSYIFRKRF